MSEYAALHTKINVGVKNYLLLFSCFCTSLIAVSQKHDVKISVIAFYNLENFYDTVNNTLVNDEEFTPNGPHNYNSKKYWDKVGKLATVISQIGTDVAPATPDGPAILGVAEVENDTVLTDLVNHPLLKKRGYKIVHYDSKDIRGVDVALLYNPKYFTVEDSRALFVQLPAGAKDAYYTRDILWVKGKFDGETIHVYVNHWPSRSGGEQRSAPGRYAAASVAKKHIDSVAAADGIQKVVLMGDLNDDPVSASVTKGIGAKGDKDDIKPGGFYNPWVDLYKKGIGTLGYNDAWNIFDQILITSPWLDKAGSGYHFYHQYIFNREYMTENLGRYKGYPMRTWDGMSYRGGYSDHFPTYVVMVKSITK